MGEVRREQVSYLNGKFTQNAAFIILGNNVFLALAELHPSAYLVRCHKVNDHVDDSPSVLGHELLTLVSHRVGHLVADGV